MSGDKPLSPEFTYKQGPASKARMVRQEALRGQLRAKAYIRVLEGIAAKCDGLPARKVRAMSLKAKIYMELLAKVLPDLKAVEHSGSIGRQPVDEMSLDAIRAELADLRAERAARAAANGSGEAAAGARQPRELN